METKQTEAERSNSATAFAPQGLIPVKTIRLDGKIYHSWVHQIDFIFEAIEDCLYVFT